MFSPEGTTLLALAVLTVMGSAVVLHAVVLLRRSPFNLLQSLLFGINYLMARILWRARVVGKLPLVDGEGGVVVSNHRCPADPSFVYLITSRMVHWMVAREYCVHPAGAWFFNATESIPVSRGGIDTTAIKMAIRYVNRGGLVGLFPEGKINTTDQVLLPGRLGAALIALKARAAVIPCYIDGAPFDGSILGCLFMPAKVEIRIGPRIDLSEYFDRHTDRQVLESLTRRFLTEIAHLAGCPDHEAQLVGRSRKQDRQ
jgi:1-acyl-sn-glycerol-3-phosphate acyltransferase